MTIVTTGMKNNNKMNLEKRSSSIPVVSDTGTPKIYETVEDHKEATEVTI